MAEKIGLEAVFETRAFSAGLSAYTSGLALASRATATASRQISALGQVSIGALRRLGELAVNGLLYAGRAALRMGADLLRAALDGSSLDTTMGEVYASLTRVLGVSLAPLTSQLNTMVAKAAPAFLAVVQAGTESFVDFATNSLAYGQNVVVQFAQGMWNGLIYVINVLTSLGNLIAGWLAPGSPPRLLPDLDKWGAEAMDVYLGGWLMADFGVFRELSGTITSYLRSLSSGQDTGLVPAILGSREAIASAIRQIRQTGQVAEGTIDGIMASLGSASQAMREYVAATLRLEQANSIVAELEGRYQDLSDAQQRLMEGASISRLELILKDPNASARAKEMARLEIEKLKLGDPLRAAKAEQSAAQIEFDLAKARLEIEIEQNSLMREQIVLLDALAKAAVETAKAAKGGGGPAGIFSPDLGLVDKIKAKISELMDKLGELRTAWENAWAAFNERMQPVYDFINNEIIPLLGTLWGIIKTEGSESIATFLKHWNEELKPDMKEWGTWAEETLLPDLFLLWTWFKTNLPEALQTFLDTWNDEWFPAYLNFHNWLRDKMFVAFKDFYVWLRIALPLALIFLKEQIETPLEALGRFLAKLTEIGLWFYQNLPIMKQDFENFKSAFVTAADIARGAIAGVNSALSDLWNWLQKTFTLHIQIPSIIIPGSPTPFEIGLRGIAAAMRDVKHLSSQAFGAGSPMARSPMSSPGMLGGGSRQSITNNNNLYYQPAYSTPARGTQADAAIMAVMLGSIGS